MPVPVTASALRIGPGGWSGVLPSRGAHPLVELSRFVDLVEIRATGECPLKPEIARVWTRKVEGNKDFLFSVVLGRRFSCERDLSPDAIRAWSEGIRPLREAGRLACVVMTFPWAFRFSHDNREFLIQLRRRFHQFPLVAEFRHESWLRDEALGTLIDYRIGFVNLDQPEYMRAMPPSAVLTNDIGYVRLLGRRNVDSIRDNHPLSRTAPYLYGRDQLEAWQPRLEKISRHAKVTIVAFSNPGGQECLVNALQMRSLLLPGQHSAPPEILKTYWRDLPEFRAPRPVQTELLAPASIPMEPAKHLAA